jgi:hypothetical protein
MYVTWHKYPEFPFDQRLLIPSGSFAMHFAAKLIQRIVYMPKFEPLLRLDGTSFLKEDARLHLVAYTDDSLFT